MHKVRFTPLIVAAALLLQPFLATAQESLKPGFDPGTLIADDRFGDSQTFGGPDGIQRFLESKGSPLASTSPEFLARLGEPASSSFKQALGDVNPQLARKRSAAELIWDASRTGGLNPQVILTTLQKEQGLVTGGTTTTPDRIQRALDHAMGFDCPDSAGCGQLFNGFYFQLFGNVDTENNRYLGSVKSLMRSFNYPNGRGPRIGGRETQVGDTITLDNSLGGFEGVQPQQTVVLRNRATAALYRYTPHVFNGNYNFWRFFTDWFKYGNGTLVRVPGDDAVYSIQSGERRRVLNFVAAARGLNLANAITISPTEVKDYPAGALYGPADDTIIDVGGKNFVFRGGIKHPASRFVLAQRKLDTTRIVNVDAGEAGQFPDGTQLTPDDGTILRGTVIADAYRVEGGVLKRFSTFTFTQLNAAKTLKYIPDDELISYPKQGWVAPLDGTLVKGPTASDVYLMGQGQKLPLAPELFKNRGFSLRKVVTLGAEEVGSFVTGVSPTPRESSYFAAAKSKAIFVFKDGAKHAIPAFVAKQRWITPDWVFDDSIVAQWPNGIAVPPRDGTLVKATGAPAVYVVIDGQLRPLTGEIFKNRRYSFKNVATLPAADVDILAKGGFAPPRELTYFAAAKAKTLYIYKAGEKHPISSFVAKQRRITPDFTFDDGVIEQWDAGTPVPPRDYTFVKGDGAATVYEVLYGKLRPLSDYAAEHRLATHVKTATILPQAEIDSYAKGSEILK
ncbi:MAG TPA: hypothetical protein VL500_05760 [Candidatus Eisenbacteria bacterium]|nr:hypothetical protein [Candidatus Eisenbacteria bacterium]